MSGGGWRGGKGSTGVAARRKELAEKRGKLALGPLRADGQAVSGLRRVGCGCKSNPASQRHIVNFYGLEREEAEGKGKCELGSE